MVVFCVFNLYFLLFLYLFLLIITSYFYISNRLTVNIVRILVKNEEIKIKV